ncbi:MAG: hypothetical protein JNN01_10890 [Opitutaceae bacterium]|nr:hypothetical protein [Opitutaceae bacterium]
MKTLLLLARQDLRAIRWWLLLALVAGVMVQTHSERWNPLNPLESWTLPVSYVVCGLAWFFMAGAIAFQHPAADPRAAWRLRPVSPWMVVVEKVLFGILVLGVFPALLGVIGSVAQHANLGDFVRGLPSMARVLSAVFAFATIASFVSSDSRPCVAAAAFFSRWWRASTLSAAPSSERSWSGFRS